MSDGGRRHTETVPARMDALSRLTDFGERVCRDAGRPRDDGLRLALVLEELFTNTVTYGHGGDCDAPVRLTLDVRPNGIAVTYEDSAPAFDPLTAIQVPAEDATLEQRPVGGLGLLLVQRLSRDLSYARIDGRNRISLVMGASEP